MSLKESTGRLARWALRLQGLLFTIRYRKGSQITVADALSRIGTHDGHNDVPPLSQEVQVCSNTVAGSTLNTILSVDNLREGQTLDPCLQLVKRSLIAGSLPPHPTNAARVRKWGPGCALVHGLLVQRVPATMKHPNPVDRLLVPSTLKWKLIQMYHDTSLARHMGFKQTIRRLHHRYTWPGMTRDVRRYCRGCLTCQQVKPQTAKRFGLLLQLPLGGPGEILCVDLIGPFPMSKSRNIYLLVTVDQFTKWPCKVPALFVSVT